MTQPDPPLPTGTARIPVIEESLVVGVERRVTGKVRVRIEADDMVENAELQTVQEDVEVERLHCDLAVDAQRAPWMDGDVLVVPVYEERFVLQRQLVLTQELRVVRRRQVHTESKPVQLRRERAVVERQQPDGQWIEVTVPQADDFVPSALGGAHTGGA